jgi:hypothetical protein
MNILQKNKKIKKSLFLILIFMPPLLFAQPEKEETRPIDRFFFWWQFWIAVWDNYEY